MDYKIAVETLTPLHIGSGRELTGTFDMMYFSKENCLAVVNADKIYDLIGQEHIEEWLQVIDRKQSVMDYLKKQYPQLKPKQVASRIVQIKGKAPFAQNMIKEHFISIQNKNRLCQEVR